MIRRTLLRRLETLEDRLVPSEGPPVMHVVFIDAATKQPTGGFQVKLGYTRPSEQSRRLVGNQYR